MSSNWNFVDFNGENYLGVREVIDARFGDINFIEETHQYFIGDVEYTPVSHIIKEYETFVDWDKKAEVYALRHHLNKADVQRKWKLNNLKSTISGTRTHSFGESYVNLKLGHPELICEENRKQYVEELNALVPTYPKEEQIVEFFEKGLRDDMFPVGAEFRLSSKYIKGARPMCGTCDLLFYHDDWANPEQSGFILGDWKTNKSLQNDYNRSNNVMMKHPFDKWVDEPYYHYTLQLNLYQKMLESVGIKVVGRMLIWLTDDMFHIHQLPQIDGKIMQQVMCGK